jgi:inhibitor of KinA sporulation pathway (predicted exonuclease)
MSRYIAIDLELEQPYSNVQTPDSCTDTERIIQVGIVVFELAAQEPTILASETMFIEYPHPLSNFISKLTSITSEEVNEASHSILSAVHRIAQYRSFFNTSRQIVEWGGGDVEALIKESNMTKSQFQTITGMARSTINAKVLFQCYAMVNDIKPQGGLSKSMRKIGLEFKNTRYQGKNKGAHWAESDAYNTARIFNKIIESMKLK